MQSARPLHSKHTHLNPNFDKQPRWTAQLPYRSMTQELVQELPCHYPLLLFIKEDSVKYLPFKLLLERISLSNLWFEQLKKSYLQQCSFGVGSGLNDGNGCGKHENFNFSQPMKRHTGKTNKIGKRQSHISTVCKCRIVILHVCSSKLRSRTDCSMLAFLPLTASQNGCGEASMVKCVASEATKNQLGSQNCTAVSD